MVTMLDPVKSLTEHLSVHGLKERRFDSIDVVVKAEGVESDSKEEFLTNEEETSYPLLIADKIFFYYKFHTGTEVTEVGPLLLGSFIYDIRSRDVETGWYHCDGELKLLSALGPVLEYLIEKTDKLTVTLPEDLTKRLKLKYKSLLDKYDQSEVSAALIERFKNP